MPRTFPCGLAAVALIIAALFAVPCQSQVEATSSPARPTLEHVLSEHHHPWLDWQGMGRHLPAVRRLYESNGWTLAWSRDGAPTPQAVELLDELRSAAHKGLIAEDYFGLPLTYLLIDLIAGPGSGPRDWALWDAGLSAALSRYVSDLHYGRADPARIENVLKVDRARLDIGVLLTGLTQSGEPLAVIADTEPTFRTYEYLKRALARYRELSMERGLTDLPPIGRKSLRPGDAWTGASQLRTLLVALGDLPATAAPADSQYTAELAAGVVKFQSRHGLDAEGVLGPATLRNLTTPLYWRVKQIELAMERWRWVPSPLDSPPVIVNIPQFRLFAFQGTQDDPEKMLAMDVIVGNAYLEHYTPVFAADMTHVVFRPYWDVPSSIAKKELLPDIRRKPGYMEKEQLEIVAGPSDNSPVLEPTAASLRLVAAGKARLRQKPGPTNSLGLVKFMLPNPYNVYLHDTPAPSLFAHSRRDFSHGCVRVSNPVGLAEYVLRNEDGWTRERIEAAMQAESSETVWLKRPIRVFFVYGTATATEDSVYFFEDIYDQDRALDEECRCANRPSAAPPPGGRSRAAAGR